MERPGRGGVGPRCCGGGWETSRRELLAAAGASAGLSLLGCASGGGRGDEMAWRHKPRTQALRVLPVFNCHIYEPKPAASWRVTGAIQTEEELRQEERRIAGDLDGLAARAGFPLELLPLRTVRTVEEAQAAGKIPHDVLVMYAARRNVPVLEALAASGPWNLMFVRHRSGPLYYMYIGSHAHFLRKRRDEMGQPGMDVWDVVVDDHEEIFWRLRSFYALKNTLGKRIVAVGGAGGWGAEGKGAPERARAAWKFDIREVSYEELEKRIVRARGDEEVLRRCREEAAAYARQPGVTLETSPAFYEKAFILNRVFRDLLEEHEADAFTIGQCMSTVMPVTGTTACLPLTILNDGGYLAFCESDFVAIPAAILLHHVCGNPVFLGNPSMPHRGEVTVSHCTAPRRMDGRRMEPVRVLTHYESDYGAATRVEMRRGQEVTVVDPDFMGCRWLGFEGEIVETPFYPICRTQLELRIHGDWRRLREEIRGFHWIVAYGRHLREVGYAVKKAGLGWLGLAPEMG